MPSSLGSKWVDFDAAIAAVHVWMHVGMKIKVFTQSQIEDWWSGHLRQFPLTTHLLHSFLPSLPSACVLLSNRISMCVGDAISAEDHKLQTDFRATSGRLSFKFLRLRSSDSRGYSFTILSFMLGNEA